MQLVWPRPSELHSKPGFLPARSTLSLGVGSKNLLFLPKMSVLLYLRYAYSLKPVESLRVFFFLMEKRIFISFF